MKLYYSPGACSLAPHIALREAGLAFTPVRASTKTHQLDDGTDFYSVNPKGYVPLLELDTGERLSEAAVILQYVADLVPDQNLAPAAGTLPRYRLQEWLNFIATELHKGLGPFFNPAMPDEAKSLFKTKVLSRLETVEAQLAKHPYLTGNTLTVADIYLFVVSGWAPRVGIDLSPFPALQAFQASMMARPAVVEAMKAEGLLPS